jgi:hypothetical protein
VVGFGEGVGADADAGGVEGGFPDVFAEPRSRAVAVNVRVRLRVVRGSGLCRRPSLGAVFGVGTAAVLAFVAVASAAGEGALPVSPPGRVRGVSPRSTGSVTSCRWAGSAGDSSSVGVKRRSSGARAWLVMWVWSRAVARRARARWRCPGWLADRESRAVPFGAELADSGG